MKFERNFNKRTAALVDVQQPQVSHGKGCDLGVKVTAFPSQEQEDRMEIGELHMHMTPQEALTFGLDLIAAARDRMKSGGSFAGDQ